VVDWILRQSVLHLISKVTCIVRRG
jgi:hypothetical protein